MQNEMILSGVVNWLKSYVTFHDDGADSGPGIVDSEAICLPSVAPAPADGQDSVAIQKDQQEPRIAWNWKMQFRDDGPPPAAAALPALKPGPVGPKVHQTL